MTRQWSLLFLTVLVLLVGTAAVGQDVGDFSQWTQLTIALSLVAGCLVPATVWQWRHRPVDNRWLWGFMLLGIVLRLLVMPSTRELSDDAARYHWDGKAIAHGINPFLFAPDDPQVATLWTDPIDDRINHPWNRTCYPPVAQYFFTLGYRISPGSLGGIQWLGLLAEILTWIILAGELKRQQRSLVWLLLIAWSPLLIFQGYLPGHVDILLLPFVALLLRAVLAGQPARAGLWLACACLIKPLPLFLLPAIMREVGMQRSIRLLSIFFLVGIAAYGPFWEAGWLLFSSTWLMATDWSFNGSVGAFLETLFPLQWAHGLSGILTGMGILAVTWRGRDFLARAIGSQLVFFIMTPTLFPWYLISTLPLLVLRPHLALLGLGILVPLSDQVVIAHQLQGIWHQASWVRWGQYLPFYSLLAWERFSTRIQNRWHRSRGA